MQHLGEMFCDKALLQVTTNVEVSARARSQQILHILHVNLEVGNVHKVLPVAARVFLNLVKDEVEHVEHETSPVWLRRVIYAFHGVGLACKESGAPNVHVSMGAADMVIAITRCTPDST